MPKASKADQFGGILVRILFKGISHPSALAKSLKRKLATRGHDVGIRVCEQHVAGMTGYANWHELRKTSKARAVAGPADEEVDPEAAAGRNRQYVAFLTPIYGNDLASAVVDAISPTGHTPPSETVETAPPSPARTGIPEGQYPFAFAHTATTATGVVVVRSEGVVRIPSLPHGGEPAFSGEFLVSREIGQAGDTLTRLDIHEVEGALYSHLDATGHSRLPDSFPAKADLTDVLLWKREPATGVLGHPLVQALALSRHRVPGNLAEHVCPPEWHLDLRDGRRDQHHLHAALYGGLQGLPFYGTARGGEMYLEGREERDPPVIQSLTSLQTKGVRIWSNDEERIRAGILAAAEGNLAIVGDEVMTRTAEPCWKLTMAKGGRLSLDLYVARYLRGRDAYEPSLFFALDEDEARDRAIEGLLQYTRRDTVDLRGSLDSLTTSACTIDGNASSMAYLAACMREALRQAAKVLPEDAALAAESLSARFPVEGYPSLAGFVPRGRDDVVFAGGIVDGWRRLIQTAGGAIRMDSHEPALAHLAGHGVILGYLASTQPEMPKAAEALALT